MSVSVALLLIAVAFGLAVTLAWAWGRRILLIRRGRAVTVRLRTGGHFHGVLVSYDAHHLLLKDAAALGVADQGTVRMEGEVAIPRVVTEYLQFEGD